MVLVSEGVLLLYRDELKEPLPAPLSDWDVIELTEAEALLFATVGVSLDDKRYVIPKGVGRVCDELARRGVEPIEIDYDHVSHWGGCVSCSTHAIWRDP